MSAQFGACNLNGKLVGDQYLDRVRAIIAPYGPDGTACYREPAVAIQLASLHTTRESHLGTQPSITSLGDVITWDGRLDNRAELAHDLRLALRDVSDAALVAAAWDQWRTESFARFVGDWALSIWSPSSQFVLLARDPIGQKHLYYSVDGQEIRWSTVLDALVLPNRNALRLNDEYVAGWLAAFPAADITPWLSIEAVPPAHYVRLNQLGKTSKKYWDFSPAKTIRYCSDREYEDHFRYLFTQAVQRRLRSDRIVVAELSGGVDSSSIVCVADELVSSGNAETCGLTTISYHCSNEPNWDEYPFFTLIEQKRGRTGCHVEVKTANRSRFDFSNKGFSCTPACQMWDREGTKQFLDYMASQGSRVVLSGIGGDEVTGGVPTPLPELQDLLARGKFTRLGRKLKEWALVEKKPWVQILFSAVQPFCPPIVFRTKPGRQAPPWLDSSFAQRHRHALSGYWFRRRLFGPDPSFQENLATFELLRRQISCTPVVEPQCERRYPYLDRDLLEFLFAIPREQLVRPGQRRSLTRRALAGIVPDEVLNRRRKAYVARWPRVEFGMASQALDGRDQPLICERLGIVDRKAFGEALQLAKSGKQVAIVPLMRGLLLECWLIGLSHHGILADVAPNPQQNESRSVWIPSVCWRSRLV